MKFKIIFLVFLIILSFGCATKKPIDYNSLMEETGAVELDADFNGAVDVDKGGTNVQTYPDLKTALSIENVDNTADTDKPVSTDQQTALDLKLDASAAFDPDSPGELGATTPAKGNFTEIEIPFVDGNAGIFWDQANTLLPSDVYGIYPYNGNMYKIENSVHSLMSTGVGGTSIVEVADTPEAWEMIPGTLYIAQDDGELSFLLANSTEVFRYAATSSTLLYPINLTVVSGTTSTVDINGTSYGNGGPYVISALTGATSMGITYDTEDTTVWSGADSGDVTGSSPTFSVNVDAIKTLIATISSAVSYADIDAHFNGNGSTLAQTYTLDPTTETGPLTAAITSNAETSVAAALVGVNGWDFTTTEDKVSYDKVQDANKFQYAYLFRTPAVIVETVISVTGFNNVATSRKATIGFTVSGELALQYRNDGGTYSYATTTTVLAGNTTYIAQVIVDQSIPSRALYLYNADGTSLIDSAENTDAFTAPVLGYTTLEIGVDDNAGLYIDNMMSSDGSEVRDFVNDEISGTKLILRDVTPNP